MSKRYRCISNQSNGLHYIPGHIYTLNDDGSMLGELGHAFKPKGHSSAVEWLEYMNWYSFEEVKGMEFIKNGKINLDALKTGDWIDVVTTAGDAHTYQVLKDTPWGVVFRENPGDSFSIVSVEYMALDTVLPVDKYTSVSVYRSNMFVALCDLRFKPCNLVFEWKNEPKRKRMTFDEIEAALGYKIAIVDEEGK